MNKYIAFLRAINVGGHNVKMDHLQMLFDEMGFKNVETFIASGNVIFEANKQDKKKIEKTIEKKLHNSLGYEVSTFIRSMDELKQIVNYTAFSKEKREKATTYNIGFIKQHLNKEAVEQLKNLETDIDDFESYLTEVYWLCKRRQSESSFSANVFERRLKTRVTLRGVKTLQKLLAKYSG